jgi:tetratricopeptide (TPR) repeat protein
MNLGNTYYNLIGEDEQANLRKAIACYNQALQVYTREQFPLDWARAHYNMGSAYSISQGEDRAANLRKAITCYEQALQVYTRESLPADWAAAQLNLGNVYSNLPGDDVRANQQRAIACYLNALQVYTHETFPVDWALTQYNRGNAYVTLSNEGEEAVAGAEGERQENLGRAIACYQAALRVFQSLGMQQHARITAETLKKTQETLQKLKF